MRIPLMLLAVLSAVVLAGSNTAVEPGSGPLPGARYPAPLTPDDLIQNFEQAINDRDIDEYARALHPEFKFIFSPGARHAVAPDSSWGRARELESMTRLFSGEAMTRYGGQRLPGVSEIDFALVAVSDWDYRSTTSETWTRHYHAFVKLHLEDGTRHVITREQVFTLTAKRNESDLAPSGFALLRWEELGCDCPQPLTPLLVKSRF